MRTNLKISVIEVKRKLRSDDDLEILQKSIKEKGVLKPILVDSDYTLLDGLRRLKAVEANGDDLVPVIVAETYEEAIEAIAAIHADVDPDTIPTHRLWELQYELTPLLTEKVATMRRTPLKERQQGRRDHSQSRKMLTEALRIQSSSLMQVLSTMHTLSLSTGPLARYARELLDRVDSGELTVHSAKNLLVTFQRDQNAARKAADQAPILNGVTNTLPGVLSPLEGLSSELDSKLSQADLVKWEAVLASSNAKIRITLNKIRKLKGKV